MKDGIACLQIISHQHVTVIIQGNKLIAEEADMPISPTTGACFSDAITRYVAFAKKFWGEVLEVLQLYKDKDSFVLVSF